MSNIQLKNLAEPTQKRKHSASLRRPFSQSTTSDDPQLAIHLSHNHIQTQEYDPKQYRLLLHCFYNNLNAYYVKGNKDVLGQLEDLYKVPLSKEQRMSLESDFEGIIARNISKLAKEGLSRNINIGRNVSQYYEAYHRYNRSELVLQTSNQPAMKTLELPQSEFQTEPTPKTYNSSYSQGQRSRPQTSVRQPHKQTERAAPILNLNLNLNPNMAKNMQTSIFRNKNAMESGYAYSYAYTSVNTAENQEGCFVYIRENYRKGSVVTGNNTHSGNRVKYHGRYHRHSTGFGILDQLGIQDVKFGGYKVSDENNMTQNTQTLNQNEKNHHTSASKQKLQQRSMPKTNINKFFHPSSSSYTSQGQNQSNNLSLGLSSHWNSRQKSIDQLERQKIQSKILAMNGTLSANVVKSQGYRPKSKCWGAPVVSHGKIVTNTDPSNNSNGNAKQGLGGKLLFSMMRYK